MTSWDALPFHSHFIQIIIANRHEIHTQLETMREIDLHSKAGNCDNAETKYF